MNPWLVALAAWLGSNVAFLVWRVWATRNDPVTLDVHDVLDWYRERER